MDSYIICLYRTSLYLNLILYEYELIRPLQKKSNGEVEIIFVIWLGEGRCLKVFLA